jgi:hypothetical protein
LIWRNGDGAVLNVHADHDPFFDTMLRYGEENFYCEWIQSVLTITALCETMSIPCIHWSLDVIDPVYQRMLRDNNIVLHNNNLDSTIWNQDRGARDQQHHSAKCHAQWAQKLKGLLNEYTTQ